MFVFNLARRKDITWGAVYCNALTHELERNGHAIERAGANFRDAAIPQPVERAFSKRREAIEAAAEQHRYRTPKGMDAAALRTYQAKRLWGPDRSDAPK